MPLAIQRWNVLSERYAFLPDEQDVILQHLGKGAVVHRHPAALSLLNGITTTNEEAFAWRLQAALRNRAWSYLEKWTQGEPASDVNTLQWNYWRARALSETGNQSAAHDLFTGLAGERDYYGFMAADHLHQPYMMDYKPIEEDDAKVAELLRQPTIQRAREWVLLDNLSYAKREWRQSLKVLSADMKRQAARLAHQWGWHYSAIVALGQVMDYDDLVVRFPLLYTEALRGQAQRQQLDVSWVFGLVRSESLFVEGARSRAGALGLMQVMPATGRQVARSLGMRGFSSNQLLQAPYNLRIGAAYLRQMYDRFGGNIVYATAAYNAGPHRVQRWHRRLSCAPADVWIEVIPFRETKKYVKQVLMNSSIYDWRLQQEVVSIDKRLAAWQLDSCPVASVGR